MPTKGIIGILSAQYGSGHEAAAQAIFDGLKKWYPELTAEVIEQHQIIGRFSDRSLRAWYQMSTGGSGRTYRLWSKYTSTTTGLRRWVELGNLLWARRFRKVLNEKKVIFAVLTYPLTALALDDNDQVAGYDVVVTDLIGPHRYWHTGETCHRYIVPTRQAADRMISHGADSSRVKQIGYPLRLSFLAPPSQVEARVRLGLNTERPLVIFLPGTGPGLPTSDVVSALESVEGVEIIIICGRDERLRRKLAREARRVNVVGFVRDMHIYMAAADVAIGKAGPGFLSEAATIGVPVIITGFIDPQERENVDAVRENGWGEIVSDVHGLEHAIMSAVARRDDQRQGNLLSGLGAQGSTRGIVDCLVQDFLELTGESLV